MITIDDFCTLDLNQITSIDTTCLNPDPACPLDALLRSAAVFNPNDNDFTRLANGDLIAADYSAFEDTGLYQDAEDGNGCATDCSNLTKVDFRACQVTWKTCISEDALARWCKGANPTTDPFMILAQNNDNYRVVENTKRILAKLAGIGATAKADPASNIVCDFATESYDGTPFLSLTNLAGVGADLAVMPDFWLADKYTVRRLRGQGFEPFCCGDNGQVFNQVAELQDPNGIPIVTMADEYASYFDPLGDGSQALLIGLQNNSIAWERTSENDTSERGRGFRQLAFSVADPCEPTTLYMNERAALHVRGFNYAGPIERCGDGLSKAQLMTAGTTTYAFTPDARRGWDKSSVVFVQGAIPNGKMAVV